MTQIAILTYLYKNTVKDPLPAGNLYAYTLSEKARKGGPPYAALTESKAVKWSALETSDSTGTSHKKCACRGSCGTCAQLVHTNKIKLKTKTKAV